MSQGAQSDIASSWIVPLDFEAIYTKYLTSSDESLVLSHISRRVNQATNNSFMKFRELVLYLGLPCVKSHPELTTGIARSLVKHFVLISNDFDTKRLRNNL